MNWNERLYEEEQLSRRAKLVYLYLSDRCDCERKAWPSVRRIARDISVSEKTVRRAIRDLEKAGMIRKEHAYRENGSFSSNRYYLL